MKQATPHLHYSPTAFRYLAVYNRRGNPFSKNNLIIMASAADEDLAASKTDGFKVGEKKTVEEYAKLGKLSIYCLLSMVRLWNRAIIMPTVPFFWANACS